LEGFEGSFGKIATNGKEAADEKSLIITVRTNGLRRNDDAMKKNAGIQKTSIKQAAFCIRKSVSPKFSICAF
jgi:hypothetical protein